MVSSTMTPREFIERYYVQLQDDRAALTAYYTDASVLIAKGKENRGLAAIGKHLANLPKLGIEPEVISEQRTPFGAELIVITGRLRHEDQRAVPFTETFLVTLPETGGDTGDTVVHNQTFFFIAG
ncbi:ketosteroid isomerase family protein [Spongiactinospora sp. TRM90649]|uniref:ketosteroid isomerase family protein n=1 Tax=Spongiactinospora sp. TRM90649 TaxID=3031114 RepID=UPI0023F99976|nr:ketosteroid isomerase family protein [Spongiactinospora sp. TRM90649]MDF5752232.1 ketosteroid isomerase family protein [Spongiactinospora sp. TRM90649]